MRVRSSQVASQLKTGGINYPVLFLQMVKPLQSTYVRYHQKLQRLLQQQQHLRRLLKHGLQHQRNRGQQQCLLGQHLWLKFCPRLI